MNLPGASMAPVLFGLAVLVVGAKLGGLVVERFGHRSVLDELAFPMPLNFHREIRHRKSGLP